MFGIWQINRAFWHATGSSKILQPSQGQFKSVVDVNRDAELIIFRYGLIQEYMHLSASSPRTDSIGLGI